MTKKTGMMHRRLLFAKNSTMMLVVLVVILFSVFAWYNIDREVSATGIVISAAESSMLQIAFPGPNDMLPTDGNFTDELHFDSSDYFKELIKDVTGDGHKFIVPTFNTNTNSDTSVREGRTVLTEGDWTEGLSSKEALTNIDPTDDNKYNYISLDFYVRSNKPLIKLCSSSYLAAKSELENNTILSNEVNANDPLKSAPFSKDAIVGAMRVSLEQSNVTLARENVGSPYTETDSDPSCTLLWLPRPDIHVTTANSETDWTLQYVKPTDDLASTTYSHSYYEGQTPTTVVNRGVELKTFYDSGLFDSAVFPGATSPSFFKVTNIPSRDYDRVWNSVDGREAGYYPTFGQEVEVADNGTQLTADKTGYGRDYYIYRMKLNVWIEGVDAEARRAMNGGKFKLFLEFVTTD